MPLKLRNTSYFHRGIKAEGEEEGDDDDEAIFFFFLIGTMLEYSWKLVNFEQQYRLKHIQIETDECYKKKQKKKRKLMKRNKK